MQSFMPPMSLRTTSEIPMPYRSIFPFPNFNAMQSQSLDKIYFSDNSAVICAPTGSGKTVTLELAILRQLQSHQYIKDKDSFKALYIAPIKALCGEKATEWKAKFNTLGLHVGELTGDTEVNEQAFLKKHHIM